MSAGRSISGPIRRLATIGVVESDDDDVRGQKIALTLAATIVTFLAVVWVATYLALDLPVSASIPFAYQVASIASLVVFARTRSYGFFRFSQAAMMTILPFLLQWSLGGYVASSVVSLWALVAAIGTLFFFTAAGSVPWFLAFLALTLVSGLIDPTISQHQAPIPGAVRTAFFVLNVTGVSVTAYVLLQVAVRARDEAFARSEGLLVNVLPRPIARRLKREPGVIAEGYDDVTVLFADIAGFTPFAARTAPARLVSVLDEVFSRFDALTERHGLEKIKTIGDAYMVAAGLPEPMVDHAEAAADLALDMRVAFDELQERLGVDLSIRIGIDSGPVVAGVIGRSRLIYDLWGDTVNTASRMESHGLPGRIQVTDAVFQRLRGRFDFEERGQIEVKGKGRIPTYLLVRRTPAPP